MNKLPASKACQGRWAWLRERFRVPPLWPCSWNVPGLIFGAFLSPGSCCSLVWWCRTPSSSHPIPHAPRQKHWEHLALLFNHNSLKKPRRPSSQPRGTGSELVLIILGACLWGGAAGRPRVSLFSSLGLNLPIWAMGSSPRQCFSN